MPSDIGSQQWTCVAPIKSHFSKAAAFKAREIGPEVKIKETTDPIVHYKQKIDKMKKKESFMLNPLSFEIPKPNEAFQSNGGLET